MKNLLTWLSRRRFPYEPLITVEISRSRLVRNLEGFTALAPGGNIAPVLKSNAYGHGLVEVARILEEGQRSKVKDQKCHISFFVVDSYFEAIALRAKRIKTPLLVIGYTRPETIVEARLKNTTFTVSNMETLRAMREGDFSRRRKCHIHIKIDTGMHRQGIMPEEVSEAIEIIRDNPSIVLEGVCSHLSDADNTDDSFTDAQVHAWNQAVKRFHAAFPKMKYWHLSNSDGHRFTAEIEANVSRLGIGLYGLSENTALNEETGALPVMEMKTILTGVKILKKGETVGYGNTFRADKDIPVANIPAGYYEGIDRRLSSSKSNESRGFISVGQNRILCPIIGRVSMNITTIDVSAVRHPKVGDEAVVISRDSAAPNSILSISKICDIITYEGAVKIPAHLKRIVVD